VLVAELGARIMDLQEPTKKMSTTGGTPQGTVLMLDEPDVLRKKIKSAVTDSGREVRRGPGKEGIENLISIMSVATGDEPASIEASYDGRGYGDFKSDVAEAVIELVSPIQSRYASGSRESSRLLGSHARAHVRADGLRRRSLGKRAGAGYVLPGS
jgi:tryptophanyl-tRNA synthetase